MWLINLTDINYVVGDCSLPPQTALEVLPTIEWQQFLLNGVVASEVRKHHILQSELTPDAQKYPYIDVIPRGTPPTSYGVCPTCYGAVDPLTGRSIGTGGGGGGGDAHTLYIADSALPADVYYEDPNTLVIQERS